MIVTLGQRSTANGSSCWSDSQRLVPYDDQSLLLTSPLFLFASRYHLSLFASLFPSTNPMYMIGPMSKHKTNKLHIYNAHCPPRDPRHASLCLIGKVSEGLASFNKSR